MKKCGARFRPGNAAYPYGFRAGYRFVDGRTVCFNDVQLDQRGSIEKQNHLCLSAIFQNDERHRDATLCQRDVRTLRLAAVPLRGTSCNQCAQNWHGRLWNAGYAGNDASVRGDFQRRALARLCQIAR